jgi:hypothetical protein
LGDLGSEGYGGAAATGVAAPGEMTVGGELRTGDWCDRDTAALVPEMPKRGIPSKGSEEIPRGIPRVLPG